MAEEQEAQAQPEGGGSSAVRKIGVAVGIVLVAAIAALLVFQFVFKPLLQEPAQVADEQIGEKIPDTVETVAFEKNFVSVVMPSDDVPASTLLYTVNLECSNPEVAMLVERHRPRFEDMLQSLHRNRTRDDWNDPMVLEDIKRQALQKANELLQRLQPEVNPEWRITAVFETIFMQDLL